MIRQCFHVESYWKVIVYYDVDYDFFSIIQEDLFNIGFSNKSIGELFVEMVYGDALAVTCSNLYDHKSVVLFNVHSSFQEYISSIVHEAEHIKQAMLKAYKIEDEGEPPAYTIGYLVKRMYPVFKRFICT